MACNKGEIYLLSIAPTRFTLNMLIKRLGEIQGDQKFSVHLMITIQITPLSQHTTFLTHYLAQSDSLAADRQGQGAIDANLRHLLSLILTTFSW
jgi:hypothetical protein